MGIDRIVAGDFFLSEFEHAMYIYIGPAYPRIISRQDGHAEFHRTGRFCTDLHIYMSIKVAALHAQDFFSSIMRFVPSYKMHQARDTALVYVGYAILQAMLLGDSNAHGIISSLLFIIES